jgi:3,4-dihydroxy 2-butanone 4-phosphate synthase/GTP cyclohydrolase II
LKGFGLTIVGRSPLFAPITLENKRYIETKRAKMGHMFGDESGAFEEAVEAAEEVNVEVA